MMKLQKRITYFLILITLISGCSKIDLFDKKSSNKELKLFNFVVSQNPSLPQDIYCEIKGDSVLAVAFSGTDLSKLKPSFNFEGKEILVNNQPQNSGVNVQDFTTPVTYNIKAEDGSIKSYFVKFRDTSLPVLYISTNNVAIQSKEIYVKGTLEIKEGLTNKTLFSGATEIRGRGNSTWGFPKKPYKIKLDKKSKLLGINEAKQWVLLANYADKSLLRNELGFELSRRLGLAYTPSSRFVDVVLNNQYIGNYQLVEQIEVSPTKVNVAEQKMGNSNISGGYLVEVDGFASTEKVYFMTPYRMPISVHYPDDEDITSEQKSYIRGHIEKFEKALFSTNFDDPIDGYKKYFDIDSYINFYLVNEIIGNPDLFWSTYFYKNQNDDKIYAGPVWDFDLSANNDNRLGDFQNKLMLTAAHEPKMWINRLMQDKVFRNKIRQRWNEIKTNKLQNLPLYIDQLSIKINASQKKNFTKWNILNEKVYRNFQAAGSFDAEVIYLKNFYINRISWLDTQFNGSRFD